MKQKLKEIIAAILVIIGFIIIILNLGVFPVFETRSILQGIILFIGIFAMAIGLIWLLVE